MATLTYLGHSGFFIEGGSHSVIVDPFISNNPTAQAAGLKADQYQPHAVLLSHGHFDHIEDAAAIAKNTKATLVAPFELTNHMQSLGVENVFHMNPGGPHTFEFGAVRLTNAVHSSSLEAEFNPNNENIYLGRACGIVLTTDDGLKIYHSGDTELFGDMALIGKHDQPDVALLPIGGVFTMDPAQALEAVKLIQPKVVIPMHYNTWPPIEQDAQAFKKQVEAHTSAQVVVLAAGQSWQSA